MADSEKNPAKTDPDNTEKRSTEQEIRRGRKFSVAEAVGREAGGALKGASPVAAADRLLAEIEELLESRLRDSEGSLARTLMACLKQDTPLLGRHLDDAPGALRELLDRVVGSASQLGQLVRDADARWGRDYGERPHFNRPGQPDHPEDPYTPEGVRDALQQLRSALD